MAWSTEISQLVTETEQFIDAVELKKPVLDAAANTAVQNAASASLAAANTAVIAASLAPSADISKGHAVATEAIANLTRMQQDAVSDTERQASLAAGYALSTGTIVQQDLSGLTTNPLHYSGNAVTSMFIYDTSKDSDGGAWTEKCQNTSWYNEDLSGKWLGPVSSELMARCQGATFGPNSIVNSTFDTGVSGFTTFTGATITLENGRGKITSVAGTQYAGVFADFIDPASMVPNALYEATFDVYAGTYTGVVDISFDGQNPTSPYSSVQGGFVRYTAYVNPTIFGNDSSGRRLRIRFNSTHSAGQFVYIDNVTYRRVINFNTPSNDYFQLATDGKFYRTWKNLLQYTEDFGTGWAKDGVTVTATSNPQEWYLTNNGVNSPCSLYQGFSILANAVFSIEMKADTIRYVRLRYGNVTNAGFINVDLQTGTSDGASTLVTPLSDGFYRVSLPFTSGADNTGIISIFMTDIFDNAAIVPSTSKRIIIRKPQFEYGSTATTYEYKGIAGTTSEVFRGNKRDFPRLAGIVAEATSVNIYDLTEPGRPMWMRFAGASGYMLGSSVGGVSLAAREGQLMVAAAAGFGANGVNFVNDTGTFYTTASGGVRTNTIALRNTAGSLTGTSAVIANATVVGVAMTVLPDAPTDPVTGLRVPTIAMATGAGISVIKQDGTVTTLAGGAIGSTKIALDQRNIVSGRYAGSSPNFWNLGSNRIGIRNGGGNNNWGIYNTKTLANLPASNEYGPYPGAFDIGLKIFDTTKTISQQNGLTTVINSVCNTGWQIGDTRRAYMSDVGIGSMASLELVTNGTFDGNNATGWTLAANVSIVNERLTGSSVPINTFTIGTMTSGISGKTYQIEFNSISMLGTVRIYAAGTNYDVNSVTGKQVRVITATADFNTITFQPRNGAASFEIDNVSVREVVADRSYKAQAAVINGAVTRTQLASGTSLVGYSGWSANNYLQEQYSADLDFGTGEFSASAWVNIPTTLPSSSFPIIGSELVTNGDFSNGSTSWTLGAGWSVASNRLVATSVAVGIDAKQSIPSLIGGNFYSISFDVVVTSGSLKINLGQLGFSPTEFFVSSSGTYTYRSMYYSLQPTQVTFWASAVFTGSVDNISVKQVSPATIFDRTHLSGTRLRLGVGTNGFLTATAFDGTTTRTATTTAAYSNAQWLKAEANYTTDGSLAILVNAREVAVTRGTPLLSLSSRYNLLSWSENVANAVWANNGATISGSTLSFGISSRIYQAVSIGTPVTGTTYTVSAQLSSPTKAKISLRLQGTTTTSDAAFIQVNLTSIPTWYSVTRTFTSSDTSISIGLDNRITFGGDEVAGDVIVTGTQLELGSTVKSYQRVTTVAETNIAPLTIGNSFTFDAPFPGSIALLKLGVTVPTAEQSTFMYEQEKQLFRADAISTLPDATSVLDMSYDDATDRWSAVSATNESYWTGLVRNSVTPVPAGTYSRISTTSGIELVSRITTNTGVDVTIPTYLLSEDLSKRAEAASKAFKEIVNFDYVGGFTASTTTGSTAITSVANLTYPVSSAGARISGTGIPTNTTIVAVVGTTIYISAAATATATGVSISFLDFRLPTGFEAETVTTAGAIRREGSTADFTRLFDGFLEAIRFAVAPGATTWVQIQASRIIS